MARPLTATVDLEAILQNYRYAKKLQPTCKAFAVVKSNAYGHGAVEVSRYLDKEVDAFAVAAIEEAIALREAGVVSPILLLEGVFEGDEWALCEQYGFWSALENAQQLDELQASRAKIEKIFLKLDSGMHRLGVDKETAPAFVAALKGGGQVGEVVLMTHFACADDLSDLTTMQQLAYFEQARQSIGDIEASVANSAAIMKWSVPEGGWIRPGIMLYGISPFAEVSGRSIGLRPAMTLSSKVISTRKLKQGDRVGYGLGYVAAEDHILATVAVGYGDGYPRHAVNGTPLQINGEAACLAGRVSMDMITVRMQNVASELAMGQEVVLWGGDVPVEEVADYAGTIGYELVTRMTARPHYRYTRGESAQ
ncbi:MULTISPECIES: alanine racemase [Marinomonas]|uniref:Alanine racemase n=1 Tax=Marinomonas arctica TaxID=383750 RepID=A0A7H1J4G9_9GAMM|nr:MULTISPECIES: alanine racemase [Marinomonas]MCS7488353.1 alanine racemase [Marinomonas sp. BSi20414]QNT05385.1 alanine racemase [Marinomonas arctica]GGN37915.1 alanine racemase [Marinomonas arctica]